MTALGFVCMREYRKWGCSVATSGSESKALLISPKNKVILEARHESGWVCLQLRSWYKIVLQVTWIIGRFLNLLFNPYWSTSRSWTMERKKWTHVQCVAPWYLAKSRSDGEAPTSVAFTEGAEDDDALPRFLELACVPAKQKTKQWFFSFLFKQIWTWRVLCSVCLAQRQCVIYKGFPGN